MKTRRARVPRSDLNYFFRYNEGGKKVHDRSTGNYIKVNTEKMLMNPIFIGTSIPIAKLSFLILNVLIKNKSNFFVHLPKNIYTMPF